MTTTSPTYDFLMPPTQPGDLGMLGSYRILGELGRGGMGYVFRAEDTVLERAVALKVMNKRIASTPNSRDRFLQEARAMAAVHHDNVVVIFEVGTHEGTPFMAMEMLRGETLEAINARNEGRSYERVIDYARQIARGLAAAHAKGIVHRDIKPANIWVEEESGRIKILDFGLALAQSPDDDPSGVGAVCGTPGYLTPEQARSDPLDDRSDLYSLGVVLYEMCTGQLPMAQTAIAEQLVALLTGEPQSLREVNPDIPQPLADLIHQLLAKEPVDRPANAIGLDKQLVEVERECEAKSEVALSLGKLQESLKQVVSQNDEVPPEPVASTEMADLSAFDTLSMPAPPELASSVTPKPGTVSRVGAQAPGAHRKTLPAAEKPPLSPVVWAGGGVLVTLLLVLGVVWLILPGQADNTVITPVASQPDSQTAVPPGPKKGKESRPSPAEQKKNKAEQDRIQAKADEEKRKAEQEKRKADEQQRKVDEAKRVEQARKAAESEANTPDLAVPKDSPVVPASPELSATPDTEQPSMQSPATDDAQPPQSVEVPDEPAAPVHRAAVTNTEGIGADSTVRAQSDLPRGQEIALFLQRTKSGEDRQHIHLRFDLQSVDRDAIRRAALRLFLISPQRFAPTEVELYGYDAPATELWEEDPDRKRSITWSNSISKKGLESLPMLAKFASEMARKSDQKQITLSSEKLAEFIKTTAGKSVSFVVAGGNAEGNAIRFYSKEASESQAPLLMLELAGQE